MIPRRRLLWIAISCTVIGLVLVSAVTCGAQTSTSVTTMRYALISAQAADLATTASALASGAGREANPVLRSFADKPLALTAVKASGFIVTDLLLAKLATKHKKAALIAGWSLSAFYSGLAIRNARIQRRTR